MSIRRRSVVLASVLLSICLSSSFATTVWGFTTAGTGAGSAAARVPLGALAATGFNDSGQLGTGDTESRWTPVTVHGLSNVVAVASGGHHTLVLLSDGTVRAWGSNYAGQLGNGTGIDSTAPVTPTGLSATTLPAGVTVVAIAAGESFSLALLSDGTVRSWGANDYGQLGVGSAIDRSTVPAAITGLTNVVAIAAGEFHALAVLGDGSVRGWGLNGNGQVGTGDTGGSVDTPASVAGLSNVTAVTAGAFHSLALLSDGTVRAWGDNSFGQLGNHTTTPSSTPVALGLTNVKAVAAGSYHSLALITDGTLDAWGSDDQGQLGMNGTAGGYQTGPAVVPYVSNATAIAAGATFSTALLDDGTVMAWGAGPVGVYAKGPITTATQMPLPGPATGLAAGSMAMHSMVLLARAYASVSSTAAGFAITPTGSTSNATTITVTSKGSTPLQISAVDVAGNAPDQFKVSTGDCVNNALPTGGSCTMSVRFAPTLAGSAAATVRILSNAGSSPDTMTLSGTAIAPLPAPSYPVAAGQLWATGSGRFGELGVGAAVDELSPSSSPIPDAVQAAVGNQFSVVVRADGTVATTGSNAYGQLGDGTLVNGLSWGKVGGLTGVTQVAAGSDHVLALRSDGTVWAWGRGNAGQLGTGSTPASQTTPARVSSLTKIVAVAAGNEFSAALRADGTVWTWGTNTAGQLGDGTTTQRTSPVQVTGVSGIAAIAAGNAHVLALGSGNVLAWGSNTSGQLGNGSTTGSLTAVNVTGIANAVQIAAGTSHSVALLADGSVRTWGWNASGQIGDGSTTNRTAPVAPTGLGGGVAQIAAAGSATTAILTDATVRDWGSNNHGQLGDTTTTNRLVPVTLTAMGHGAASVSAGPSASQVLYVARPHVTTDKVKLMYAAIPAGQTSASNRVTVSNDGKAPLVIGTVDIVGSDGDEFTKVGDACAGVTLAPGASCAISIRYKPVVDHMTSGTTPSDAYLRVTSNDPDGPKLIDLDPPAATDGPAAVPTTPLSAAPASPASGVQRAICILTRARYGALATCALRGSGPWQLAVVLRRRGHTIARATRRTSTALVHVRLRARHQLRAGRYTLLVTTRAAASAQRFTQPLTLAR